MEILIEKTKKCIKKKFKGKLSKLLKVLDINPGTVVVTRNNTLITTEDALSDKDKIKIMSVVSGG
jgi:sulfur carrier protein ThiS